MVDRVQVLVVEDGLKRLDERGEAQGEQEDDGPNGAHHLGGRKEKEKEKETKEEENENKKKSVNCGNRRRILTSILRHPKVLPKPGFSPWQGASPSLALDTRLVTSVSRL